MTDPVPCPLSSCPGTLRQDPQTGDFGCTSCAAIVRPAEAQAEDETEAEIRQGCRGPILVLAAVWASVVVCIALARGLTS